MKSNVFRQLGMKRRTDHIALAHSDNGFTVTTHDLDFWPPGNHDGSTNKDGAKGLVQNREGDRVFEAVGLAAEGVTANKDIQKSQPILVMPFHITGKQNHAHACSPDRDARSRDPENLCA